MDWIFQANPTRFDLSSAIQAGSDRHWAMNQRRGDVSVGDRVFFWESGPDARFLAVGRVASPVYERDDSEFGRFAVDVSYEYRLEPPLTREEILSSPPPLGTYKPFAWPMGTNHLICDHAVVEALDAALQGRLVPLAPGPLSSSSIEESQIDLEKAIKNANRQAGHNLAKVISEMDPIAFEWLIRSVLVELGYADIVVTRPSNDNGVDLRARLVAKGVTSIQTAVQVKRTSSVGRPVVQNLRGALSAHESGLLVTSGRFTEGAEEEAREPTKTPIALINGSKLIDLLLKSGIGAKQKAFKVYTADPEALLLEPLKERANEVFTDEAP